MIKISAIGAGVAAILAAGSILLAILSNPAWTVFLTAAVVMSILSLLARKI